MGRRRKSGLAWLAVIGVLALLGQFVPHGAPNVTLLPPGDSATPAPSVASPTAAAHEVRYVAADVLNLRASASTTGAVVGKLTSGQALTVVGSSGGWLQVELEDGAHGWVSGDYVSISKPQQRPPKQALVQRAAPAYDRAEVAKQIIRQSIAAYPGNCACPYNTDRAGRSCGRRSAWSKAGGYAPICYPDDVTDSMIRDWLARH